MTNQKQTDTPAVWLIKVDEHGEREDFNIEHGIASISWSQLPNLSEISNHKDMATMIRSVMLDASSSEIEMYTSNAWTLLTKVRIGDWVILRHKRTPEFALGIVNSEYWYWQAEQLHVVAVDWKLSNMPLSVIKQDLQHSINTDESICSITNEAIAWRLDQILLTGEDPGAQTKPDSEATNNTISPASTEYDEADISYNTTDAIKKAADIAKDTVDINISDNTISTDSTPVHDNITMTDDDTVNLKIDTGKPTADNNTPDLLVPDTDLEQLNNTTDLEQLSMEQIRAFLVKNFSGHKLNYLVAEILKVEGFSTKDSLPGPTGDIDMFASRGPLGLNSPILFVQIKSTTHPVNAKTIRELHGLLSTHRAEHALLVAWGGITDDAHQELRNQFFQVRVWDSDDLLKATLRNYNKLSKDIRTNLPLKQVWSLADQ